MPSIPHEILVQVLREHPEVVAALLKHAFGRDLGEDPEVLAAPSSVAELEPAEFRADVVLRVRDPEGRAPPSAIVVEVQLRVDADKGFAWPLYIAGLRARLRCPVTLVVLTLDDQVAGWAAAAIPLDDNGSVVRPLVLGPADIPTITDAGVAAASPELAVISMLAHGREPGAIRVGRALLEACRGLDDSRGRLYTDVVFAFLDDVARRALEADMQLDKYEYQSEFARRFVAQGREEGREEGIAALAHAIFEVFATRGIAVDESVRARIDACRDLKQLEAWLRAAITAPSADALFA